MAYPTSVTSFTTKSTGDVIAASDVNNPQTDITAIENYVGTNASQTTPAAANRALYSTSSTATTWGTLPAAAGGTGVSNNAASTLTISGNFGTTLTVSGTTGVTLPTAGTLSTLAGSEELTNKTLNASVGKGTWTASGTWTLPAVTMGGAIQLTENADILLDASLSADGKYCGITEIGTAGEALVFGNVVYFKAADSRWWRTNAGADATAGAVMVGICVLAAAAGGNATTIMRYGKINAASFFPTMTVGAPVYVSTTVGTIQTAQPSATDQVIRIIGYGITGDELLFNPSNDYITHT